MAKYITLKEWFKRKRCNYCFSNNDTVLVSFKSSFLYSPRLFDSHSIRSFDFLFESKITSYSSSNRDSKGDVVTFLLADVMCADCHNIIKTIRVAIEPETGICGGRPDIFNRKKT